MKRFWTRRRTPNTARGPKRSRLRLETLEARDVPANHLLIDFSPDAVPNEGWQPAAFAAAFNIRYANGYAPAFLDFNQDGWVGSADVGPGAQAIANRVAQILQPFDVKVWYGDAQSNTNLGWQWYAWGQQSSDQVFVMYTGGIRQNGNTDIIGEAFQPAVGYVNEYYAYTYATSITYYFMNYWSGATPGQFVDKVAQTIVHEFGHLVGLGHVYGNPVGDPNLMNYNSNASNAYIPDAWYQYIEQYDNYRNAYWGWQNPAQELRASLRGEPNYANYWRGLYSRSKFLETQKLTAEEIMGDEYGEHLHEVGHHEHTHDAGDELMPDAHARRAPQGQATTSVDLGGLVALQAETRLKSDREKTRVPDPVVPTPSPQPVPESAGGRIVSTLDLSIWRGRGDRFDLEDTTPLDLASLPGISLKKDEFRLVY
jgi:hypothetical protein